MFSLARYRFSSSIFVLSYVIYSNKPPHLGHQTFHHFEWSIGLRASVTASRNPLTDVDNSGGDDQGRKVVAVGKNSPGKEKPKPN